MVNKTIREILFRDMTPCSDGYCIIGGKAKGMHTNGGCRCVQRMNNTQLNILQSRIRTIVDKEIEFK